MSGFAKFREKAAASDSVYLRPAEIDGSVKLRVIPWILGRALVPIGFYYEGWHDVKTKGKTESKPIRFPINEDTGEPDGDLDSIEWTTGKFGVQRPKGAFVCVVANMKAQKIQIFSGTQKTLVGPLSALLDPNDDLYIKDWSAYELIITKDEKTDKFTINREKLDKEDRGYPKWFEAAMSEFHFKMQDYLDCEKTAEGEGDTWEDVKNFHGDKPDEEEPKRDFEIVKDWGDVKTPKGKILRQCTLEELKNMKAILDKNPKNKGTNLYNAILSGIKANDQPEFEPEPVMAEEDIAF